MAKSGMDAAQRSVKEVGKKVWVFLMRAVNMVSLDSGEITVLNPSDRNHVAIIRSHITSETTFRMLAKGKAVATGSVPRQQDTESDLTMLGWAGIGDDDDESGMLAFVPVGEWFDHPDKARAAHLGREASRTS